LQVFNIWQNVDLNKIAIAIACTHIFLLYCGVKYGFTADTSNLKVGEGGITYILPPNIADNNVLFPLLSQKLGVKRL
jgi:hypothetical protein